MKHVFLAGLCLASFSNAFGAAPSDWKSVARGLLSEDSKQEQETADRLRAMPGLNDELKKALATKNDDFPIALAVVRSLGLKAFAPDLMKASAEGRGEGMETLATLNALVDNANKAQIAKFYKERPAPSQSAASLVLALSGLVRCEEAVPTENLAPLLDSSSYEVRTEVVQYAGHFIDAGKHEEYLKLVEASLTKSPYQLRMAAIDVLSKLPDALKKKHAGLALKCKNDANGDVREACARFQREATKL